MTAPEPDNVGNTPDGTDSGSAPGAPSAEELRRALKAFKKRLKLARLDDESRLGHRAMTKGSVSDIVGVPAPNQYPQAVWDELVRQGRLKYSGRGIYELVKPPEHK